MQRRFHALAGAAGALVCGIAAAFWCASAPPPFAASAAVSVENDAPTAFDFAAIRTLAASDAVLRKAALAPQAAPAIAQEARPGPLHAFGALLGFSGSQTDTLGRAADLLAARVAVEPGPSQRSAKVVVRMETQDAANKVAEAIAEAIVATHNEAAARVERQLDTTRRDQLAKAERRREAALDRLANLKRIDAMPVGSIAPRTRVAPDEASLALADAQRAAVAAETRRAEAARIYGPRHPQMIQIETDVRRATAALQAARARVASRPAQKTEPSPSGGPDPRVEELALAQEEADRAQAAYEREADSVARQQGKGLVVEPARILSTGGRTPASYIVGASAILGFLLFGAAPALGNKPPGRLPATPTSPRAVLRRGAFSRADARLLMEALDVAGCEGARRIAVCGDDAQLVADAQHALALAALQAGWRPLLVETAPARRGRDFVVMEGRTFATSTKRTSDGRLVLARPFAPTADALDVDTAFDLVIFPEGRNAPPCQRAVWISPDAPPADMLRNAPKDALLWIAPA